MFGSSLRASDELLLQGIRSIRSGERVAKAAGSPSTVYALADGWRERMTPLNLTLGEKLVLERLGESEQTVAELCRTCAVR